MLPKKEPIRDNFGLSRKSPRCAQCLKFKADDPSKVGDDEVKKPFALPEVRLWSLKHIYNRNNQAVFDPFDVWRNFTVSFIFQLILFDIYFCFKIDFKRVLKPKIISIFFFLFHFVLLNSCFSQYEFSRS